MFKRSLLLCGLLFSSLLVSSCFLDPDEGEQPPVKPGETQERKDLTQKWHVLNNIEYAYGKRRYDVYTELLNQDFTFFFAPGDVGGEIPQQFGYDEELDATSRLFVSNSQSEPPADPVCQSIRLDLVYEPEDLQWLEIVPEDFPTETWYQTTVFYSFTFKMENDLTFIANDGAKAQFTVRDIGTAETPKWTLIEFKDLGS